MKNEISLNEPLSANDYTDHVQTGADGFETLQNDYRSTFTKKAFFLAERLDVFCTCSSP
jgi:hypothetical protein